MKDTIQHTLFHPLSKIALALLSFSLAAALLASAQKSSALQPFVLDNLERIYISEHFRDDGQVEVVGCITGDFADPSANAMAVWEFFADKLPAHQIAGIIGNMQAESGVLPQVLEGRIGQVTTAEELTAAQKNNSYGEGGRGWGIVQWTPAGKMVNTFENITDANLLINQLNFLWDQLEGRGPIPERLAGDALKGATNVDQATRIFMERFERPAAEYAVSSYPERLEAAEGAFVRFMDIPTVDTPVNAPIDGAVPEFPTTSVGQPGASSCSEATDGEGDIVTVAQEQLTTQGANFRNDVEDGNSADFVSWAFRQAGVPLTGGTEEDGWRYSSVIALLEFFQSPETDPDYTYFEAGTESPRRGDIAFYIDPDNDIEYTDIVVSYNAETNTMTVIGTREGGSVFQTDNKSAELGANGLIGFGRALSQAPPASGGGGSGPNGDYAELNNPTGITQYCPNTGSMTQSQINGLASGRYGPFHSDCFTEPTDRADNGGNVQGQFRILCNVSHFSNDDPIIFPNQPGAAHLHMFWGNTNATATTNFVSGDTANNLLESGHSTCQGGALNRSAYWAPALLSGGAGPDQKIVVPKAITLYYKSYRPWEARELPQGIQLLIGNVQRGGAVGSSFSPSYGLGWGCYIPSAGQVFQQFATIPGTGAAPACGGGTDIQATIQFPQCLQTNGGQPVLTSGDFLSHTVTVPNQSACRTSHPWRVPQISYLIRWRVPSDGSANTWRLSSDEGADRQTGSVPNPGGSLHGDWLGGWNDDAIDAWLDGCFRVSQGPGQPGRNCSGGQTGRNGTNLRFRPLTGANLTNGELSPSAPHYLDIPTPTGGGEPGGQPAPDIPGGCTTPEGYINPRANGVCVGVANGNSLPVYQGNRNPRRTITVGGGTTIDGQLVFGCINVTGANVIIRNSKIICNQGRDITHGNNQCRDDFVGCFGTDGTIHSQSSNLLIENNDILCGRDENGSTPANEAPCDYAIAGSNFTARFNNIYGVVDGFYPTRNANINFNYIHDLGVYLEEWIPPRYSRVNRYSHADGIQLNARGGGNVRITGNFFQGNSPGNDNAPNGLQAMLIQQPTSNQTIITNNRIDGRWRSLRIACVGGAACQIANNVIDVQYRSTGGAIWSLSGGATNISNNVFDDGGGPVTGVHIRTTPL